MTKGEFRQTCGRHVKSLSHYDANMIYTSTQGRQMRYLAAFFMAVVFFVSSGTVQAGDGRGFFREGRSVRTPTVEAVLLSEAYFEPTAPGPYDLAFKFEDSGEICLGTIRVTWVMRTRLENRATGTTLTMNCPRGEEFIGLVGSPVAKDGLGGLSLDCLGKSDKGCMNAILRTGTPFTLTMTRKAM